MTRFAGSVTDEEEVPPAVICPFCGRSECVGCEPPPHSRATRSLAWEASSTSWLNRLFRTAVATSTDPEQVFGELVDGRLGPALAFAAIAETFAIGSLAAAAALSLLVVAPDLAVRALADPLVLSLLFATVVVGVVLMIVLHGLWGLCLEMGARGSERGARFTHGLRFGLYACGWDLLTSPAGVLHGLAARGPIRAFPPIVRATQAPRIAMRAYLENCRRLDGAAQRRGKRLTLIVLGAAFFGISTAVGALFVWLFVPA